MDDDPQEEAIEAPETVFEKPIEWDGLHIDAADVLYQRGASYGTFVNMMRALPDVRDGLKNVQRRIIWGMAQQHLTHDRGFKKCALSVGSIMGKYHPHGDSSIYEALVNMAQDFHFQLPLVHGQGNFGSSDGDPAAAQRYTEAKLSQVSSEWLGDAREEIVEFRDNFSEDAREPVVLPVSFPNLLVNGSEGIGWSLACNVPPHNLQEVIDATLLLIDNPEAGLPALLKKLPAPDFPTGGLIVNSDELSEAYEKGRGVVKVQARMHIENISANQQAVIVTELPYQIKPSQVAGQIVQKAQAGKITEITEQPINNLDRNGLRFIVPCKRKGNPQVLLQQLLQHTNLQTSQKLNFTVLYKGRPKTISLTQILQSWIDFRSETIERRLQYEKDKKLSELHQLTALRSSLDVIDRVIKIIRESKDDEETKSKLKDLVKVTPWGKKKRESIDDAQAQYIMDMRLRQLNQLNQLDLDEKIKIRENRLGEIEAILGDKEQLMSLLKEELRDVRKRFGQARKTGFAKGESAEPVQNAPGEDVYVWIGGDGSALATDKLSKQALLSQGTQTLFRAKSDQEVLAYSAGGMVYRVRVGELPRETRKSKGHPWINLAKNDRIVSAHVADGEEYLALVTCKGEVKRIAKDVLTHTHPGGSVAVNIGDDELLAVVPHPAGAELFTHTAQGRSLRTSLDDIRPVKSAQAGGVALMKLKKDDTIVSAYQAEGDEILIVHETGGVKRVPLIEYSLQGRGGQGIQSADPSKPSRQPVGLVTLACPNRGAKHATLLTQGGALISLEFSELPSGSRAAASRPYLSLAAGDAAHTIIID